MNLLQWILCHKQGIQNRHIKDILMKKEYSILLKGGSDELFITAEKV